MLFIGLFLLAVSMNEYIDPRRPLAEDGRMSEKDILTVEGLKAYYLMNYYGISREVRAVDDITMTVKRNEIYGIAGESSSGKTSFIKVLAAAIRPPLEVVSEALISTSVAR